MSEDKKYGFAGDMYWGSVVAVYSLHKKRANNCDNRQNSKFAKKIEKVSNEMECTWVIIYSERIENKTNNDADKLIIDEDFTGVSGREYKIELSGTVYKDGYGEAISKTTTKTCP